MIILMSTITIALFYICFTTIAKSKWIQPTSPKLPRADYCLSAGFYNGSIYLLGGCDYATQLTEYVIEQNAFINHGRKALNTGTNSHGVYGYGQFWTQINHLLYIQEHYGINREDKISIFNMRTKQFSSSVIGGIPTDGNENSCMTSNTSHLFVLGGDTYPAGQHAYDLALVRLYHLTTNQWITNAPSMNSARCDFACIIHPINGKLYAIGGIPGPSSTTAYTSSIEVILSNDITHETWSYISDTLTHELAWLMGAIHKENIYVVGGGNSAVTSKDVYIINALTDEVNVLSDPMPIAVTNTAPIVVDKTLYVFAGWTEENNINGGIDTWMMYDLAVPTALPTTEPIQSTTTKPTVHPTTAPTKTTAVPSVSTTNIITSTQIITTSLPTKMDFTTRNPVTGTSIPPTHNTTEDRVPITAEFDTTKSIPDDSTHDITKDGVSSTDEVDVTEPIPSEDKEGISPVGLMLIIIVTITVLCMIAVIVYCCFVKNGDMFRQNVNFMKRTEKNNAVTTANGPGTTGGSTDTVTRFEVQPTGNDKNGGDNSVSLEGIGITVEGEENVGNEAMCATQTGTDGFGNDLEDAQEYQSNPNIAMDEFIICGDENCVSPTAQ